MQVPFDPSYTNWTDPVVQVNHPHLEEALDIFAQVHARV